MLWPVALTKSEVVANSYCHEMIHPEGGWSDKFVQFLLNESNMNGMDSTPRMLQQANNGFCTGEMGMVMYVHA